jgi:hypothetical protein
VPPFVDVITIEPKSITVNLTEKQAAAPKDVI